MMRELDSESLTAPERIYELAEYLEGRSDRETRVADNLFRQAVFISEHGV